MGSVTQNTVCLYSICQGLPSLQPLRFGRQPVLVIGPFVVGQDLAQFGAAGRIRHEPASTSEDLIGIMHRSLLAAATSAGSSSVIAANDQRSSEPEVSVRVRAHSQIRAIAA